MSGREVLTEDQKQYRVQTREDLADRANNDESPIIIIKTEVLRDQLKSIVWAMLIVFFDYKGVVWR